MSGLIFCTTLSATFLVLRKTDRDIIKIVHRSSCKVPAILVRFQLNTNFSRKICEKSIQITNFMKILPVADEFFRADGRTDRHNDVNSQFSKFCESALKILPTQCVYVFVFNPERTTNFALYF
jgi:hypothetical protein